MAETLYKRAMTIAQAQGMSEVELEQRMSERGLHFPAAYMDTFANPDDIRVIAEILEVPSSRLFEVTNFIGDLVDALFEEMWPQHADKIERPREVARDLVLRNEFKWNSLRSSIRHQVKSVLRAMETTFGSSYGCQYPDCVDCTNRCLIDGHLLGPEG